MRHCFHEAPDPRCEGFPMTVYSRTSLFAYTFGPSDAKPDEGQTMIHRHKARVCCRCGEIREIEPAKGEKKKAAQTPPPKPERDWLGRTKPAPPPPPVVLDECPVAPTKKAVTDLTEPKKEAAK